jgi:hypothetical protein
MIAAKILGYYWIDGKLNPAKIVIKHWPYPQNWHLLELLRLYSGDPGDSIEPAEHKKEKAKTDISANTHPFQFIRLVLERHTPVDVFRAFEH